MSLRQGVNRMRRILGLMLLFLGAGIISLSTSTLSFGQEMANFQSVKSRPFEGNRIFRLLVRKGTKVVTGLADTSEDEIQKIMNLGVHR